MSTICCSWAGPATTATPTTSSARSLPARQSSQGPNFARYCDQRLDQLISAGKTTNDQSVRSRLYQQAQGLIQQQALWLPLAHPTAAVLMRKDVEGYTVSPFGRQDFATVKTAR